MALSGAIERGDVRSSDLCRFLVVVVLVVTSLRGFAAVIAQLRQLLVEGLDGGFLLFENFLYQIVALRFAGLFLGKEFLDRIIWHDAIMPENFWSRGAVILK
jgi:hypothetical protein